MLYNRYQQFRYFRCHHLAETMDISVGNQREKLEWKELKVFLC